MSNSCLGCKFLYGDGSGYSNYTWMETYARCALDKNPALSGYVEVSFDLAGTQPKDDKWSPTMNGRCDRYSSGPYVILDPDREDDISETTSDQEQIAAIRAHDGR